jgi:hypothetical protein
VQIIGLPIFIAVALAMNLKVVGTKSIVGFAVSIAQLLINVVFGYVYGSYQKVIIVFILFNNFLGLYVFNIIRDIQVEKN